MSIIQAILLGIIQGLTEFLPISSSAHLVLVPYFFGWQFPADEAFVFNVLVQNGTLLAVIVYFWKDLIAIFSSFFRCLFQRKPFAEPEARLGWYLILATIPAGLFGLLAKDFIESVFSNISMTAVFLFITAGMLLIAERISKGKRDLEVVDWKDALVIGGFQALAVFPGISRSGSTITGGMLMGLKRTAAARFAFLMSIPIMLAAGLLETLQLFEMPNVSSFLPVVAAGFLAAAVVGYLSIRWLITYLMRHSLTAFSIYCVIVGVITLILTAIR